MRVYRESLLSEFSQRRLMGEQSGWTNISKDKKDCASKAGGIEPRGEVQEMIL